MDIDVFIHDSDPVPLIELEHWEEEGTKGLRLDFDFERGPTLSVHVFDAKIEPFVAALREAIERGAVRA